MDWKKYQSWLSDLTPSWQTPAAAAPLPALVCTDSRQVQNGSLFVPIKGEKFNGHAFIGEALKKGAGSFLYATSDKAGLKDLDLTKGIEVRDTLAALQAIAKGWRQEVAPQKVLALTGSVGKTTTKELLRSIFDSVGHAIVTYSSLNNEIGVPLTLLRMEKSTKFLVLEFGARHIGDIKFLTNLATPDVCVCLNVGQAHLAEFRSVENLLNTKLEIFRDSPPTATLVANHDDPRILSAAQALKKPVVSFGHHKEATVQIVDAVWQSGQTMCVELKVAGREYKFNLGTAHESLPINVAAAVAAAHACGVDMAQIGKGLTTFAGVSGRFRIYQAAGLTIVDDTYNANPDSMAAGLRSCAKLYPQKKTIAVLGDMLELGEESEKMHLAIGALCQNELKPDLLITVGKESLHIGEGAKRAGLAKDKILNFASVEEAARLPEKIFRKREVVFIKGSHAIALDKLVHALRGQEAP